MSRPYTIGKQRLRWPAAAAIGVRRSAVGLLLLLTACHQVESPSLPRAGGRAPADVHAEAGQLLKGRSLRVQDGDSFIVRLDDGSKRTIRLSGVDAPERSQPGAESSTQNLRRLLDNRDLQVRVAKIDTYGRAVAQVFVDKEGKPADVGLSQVADGMAWFYRRYRDDLPAAASAGYEEAEKAARSASRGLWQANNPEPPWEFRRQQESSQSKRR
ncbi:MAG TPA: thermonuclease family protein [Lautropia sp.]|nr:thermonuclease family protein [Lautropia sp.]